MKDFFSNIKIKPCDDYDRYGDYEKYGYESKYYRQLLNNSGFIAKEIDMDKKSDPKPQPSKWNESDPMDDLIHIIKSKLSKEEIDGLVSVIRKIVGE